MKPFDTYFNLDPYWIMYLYPPEIQRLYQNAKITFDQAMEKKLSGDSRFMNRDPDRLMRDGVIGQIGNMTLNILMYGRRLGPLKYQETRDEANANPDMGDNGKDCPDFQIDIKGSGWHCTREKILESPNGLLNRDQEWGREAWINGTYRPEKDCWKDQYYVHFFVQTVPQEHYHSSYNHVRDEMIKVVITGWIKGTDVTNIALSEDHGIYEGAYCTPIPNLNPMTTFPFKDCWWVKNGMKKEIDG